MNTKKTNLFLTLLLGAMLLMVVGCDSDDDIAGPDTSELFATWAQSSATVDGQAAVLADVFDWSETTVGVHITLNADLTYSVNEFDASDSTLYFESGTLTIDGSHIIVTTTTENGNAVTPYASIDGTWAISGNNLVISATEEGHALVLTLTKVI